MPESFINFYHTHLVHLVDRSAATPKKLRKQERKQDKRDTDNPPQSGDKSVCAQNFTNARTALYAVLGNADDVVTLRDWIRRRYDDKMYFFHHNYVRIACNTAVKM